MLPPHKHLLLLLLLAGLLLLGGGAGAPVGSEAESSARAGRVPSSGGSLLAKEGSSARIECNVTGGHEDIKWYNSKGHLLGDDAGTRGRKIQHYILCLSGCVTPGTVKYTDTKKHVSNTVNFK